MGKSIAQAWRSDGVAALGARAAASDAGDWISRQRVEAWMKKLLLTAAVLALTSSIAITADGAPPPAAPPPPPLGWVYGPYTSCADPPRCSAIVVNVAADGLNVRTVPNGYPLLALVNGTPVIPLQR